MNEHNLPVLYENIMFGLPSEFAKDVFLWASDRTKNDRLLYKAERFAREADLLVATVGGLIELSAKVSSEQGFGSLDEDQAKDLLDFILKRHANMNFGGNVSPTYTALEAPGASQ